MLSGQLTLCSIQYWSMLCFFVSSMKYIVCSTHYEEMDGPMGQYCRRVSTCVVRANAQCLISRVGVISPAEAVEGGEEGTGEGQPEGGGLGQEWPMPLLLLNLRLEGKKEAERKENQYYFWLGPTKNKKIF